MDVTVAIEVTLPGLDRFKKTIRAQLASGTDGPVQRALFKWAVRYRAFIQRRFNTYSRGGGDWAPLKESTILKRRGPAKGKESKIRVASILRDTNSLFNALAPSISAPAGSINKLIPMGIEVGYGGPDVHPDAGVSIATLAYWHQTGAGRLPVREIIVNPDEETVAAMVLDMQRACDAAS